MLGFIVAGASYYLAKYFIPGCDGRGPRLGPESSAANAANAASAANAANAVNGGYWFGRSPKCHFPRKTALSTPGSHPGFAEKRVPPLENVSHPKSVINLGFERLLVIILAL